MRYFNAVAARLQNAWFAVSQKQSGQTLVEYAMIIGLVSIAVIAAIGFFSGKLQGLFSSSGSKLP